MRNTTPVTPLFCTGNVQFNIDKDGNNLSIPTENSPEKAAEKNYHNFEDGYITKDEIIPFWDADLGEEEVDDDAASLPEVSEVAPLVQPLLVEQPQVAQMLLF
jgi:hypothetical protein